jgi:hypothetical protein
MKCLSLRRAPTLHVPPNKTPFQRAAINEQISGLLADDCHGARRKASLGAGPLRILRHDLGRRYQNEAARSRGVSARDLERREMPALQWSWQATHLGVKPASAIIP